MELPDPAPAGVEDKSGQSAVVWMITKMPPVVSKAFRLLKMGTCDNNDKNKSEVMGNRLVFGHYTNESSHVCLQAKLALDQFHTTDRANRKQYFHLHRLEPRKPGTI